MQRFPARRPRSQGLWTRRSQKFAVTQKSVPSGKWGMGYTSKASLMRMRPLQPGLPPAMLGGCLFCVSALCLQSHPWCGKQAVGRSEPGSGLSQVWVVSSIV